MNKHKNTSTKSHFLHPILMVAFVLLCHSLQAQFSDTKMILPDFKDGIYDLGDLDSDGDLDVVVVSSDYNRSLVWFENMDTAGSEWETHVIELDQPVNGSRKIKTVDIDNDGDQDFLILTYNTLFLFKNNNTTTEVLFSQEIVATDVYWRHLEVGDFDNNENTIDILTGKHNTYLKLSFDASSGSQTLDTLTTPSSFHITGGGNLNSQIVDLDLDGDNDILLGSFDYDFIVSPDGNQNDFLAISYGWLENMDGDLDFSQYHEIHKAGYYEPYIYIDNEFPGMYAGDFNGDGLPDLVYFDYEYLDPKLTFLAQNADTTFTTSNSVAIDFFSPSEILSADLDNDGDLDLISGNAFNPKYWYQNDGAGSFTVMEAATIDGNFYGHNIALGDVDNDDDIDVFYFNSTLFRSVVDGLMVSKNDGAGIFAEEIIISDNIQGTNAVLHDVDSDGDEDLIIPGNDLDDFYWVENLPGDSLSVPQLLIENSGINRILSFADLDTDGNKDLVAKSHNDEVLLFKALPDAPYFSSGIIIIENFISIGIHIADLDVDGDIDIVGSDKTIYINDGSGNFTATIILDDIVSIYGITDVTNDGLPDILFRNHGTYDTDEVWVAVQNSSGGFNFEEFFNLPNHNFVRAKLEDIDSDGDTDILVLARQNGDNQKVLFCLFNENGVFGEPVKLLDFVGNSYLVADLDGDGKKDIITTHFWYRQLTFPQIFSGQLAFNQYEGFNTVSIMDAVDWDQDGDLDLLAARGDDGLVWLENQIDEGFWVTGNVFRDENQNCSLDGVDSLLNIQIILEFEGTTGTYQTNSNLNGTYNILLPEADIYDVTITPPSTMWESCLNNSTIQIDSSDTLLDIPMTALADCPLMNIHVGSSPFRPCIPGSFYVNYHNNGTVIAENVQIEVMPDENLIINDISPQWTTMTDSSYIFDVGSVTFTDLGVIYFNVTPDCNNIDAGELICIDAYVTPDSLCLDSLWDGSVISAFGDCDADSVFFTLTNIGQGNMVAPRNYQVNIINDDIVMLINLDTFLLEAGETKVISMLAQNNVVQIQAEQDPNFPNGDDASVLVTDCAGLTINDIQNLMTNYPDQDGSPFSEHFCRVITGAYDPNSKEAIPEGYGSSNYIDREWDINYTINFQNIGNDTAFTVLILDQLSEHLDISTLRVQGGSHPFEWNIDNERTLSFIFPNILLPDSLTNVSGSQGFVNFTIKPEQDSPFDSKIYNEANIYFDFNSAIITNITDHTIRTPIFATTEHLHICEGNEFGGFVVSADTLVIDSLLASDGLYLHFQHVDLIPNTETTIDTSMLVGEILFDVIIENDTSIVQTLLDEHECPYTVTYNVFAMTTSVNELKDSNHYTVFPNPANDQLTISWTNPDHAPIRLEIYDINGTLIRKSININSTQQIKLDASELNPGIILLKFVTKNEIAFQKVMITN